MRSPQNWTQYSRCGPSCTEQRVRIMSFNLLATLFTQPRIPLVVFAARARCWLLLNLAPTAPSGPFLHTSFPGGRPPAYTGAWGCSSPGAGLCTFPHNNDKTFFVMLASEATNSAWNPLLSCFNFSLNKPNSPPDLPWKTMWYFGYV